MSKIQYEIIETVITERDDNVGVHAEMVNEWLSDYYEEVIVIGLSTVTMNGRLITTIHYKER